mmetsp:Transcript_2293/g.4923  ORF Transcript_2293/g.4923 Transcript_2293/m.4923 type:complete len:110 (+) Transcript_2293:188-517(+)
MSSSRFLKLMAQNKSAWKAGLAVVTVGVTFKVTYFNFSRGVLVDHMDARHLKATENLKDARQFGIKMAKDREERAPPLTPEQREQLHEYLRLMKRTQPDVYPKETGRFD